MFLHSFQINHKNTICSPQHLESLVSHGSRRLQFRSSLMFCIRIYIYIKMLFWNRIPMPREVTILTERWQYYLLTECGTTLPGVICLCCIIIKQFLELSPPVVKGIIRSCFRYRSQLVELTTRQEEENKEEVKDKIDLINTDDENDEEEYESWKIRELRRMKRDRDERDA